MASLKSALTWANLTTFLGAVAAIPMALYVNTELVKAFGGSGLLPKGVPITDAYLAAVGVGAALTVLLASRLGIPVSTTHGLMGALTGRGWWRWDPAKSYGPPSDPGLCCPCSSLRSSAQSPP